MFAAQAVNFSPRFSYHCYFLDFSLISKVYFNSVLLFRL